MTFLKCFVTIADIGMALILIYFLSRAMKEEDSIATTGFAAMLITYIFSIYLIWN